MSPNEFEFGCAHGHTHGHTANRRAKEKGNVKTFNFTESRVGGLAPPAKGEATYRYIAIRLLEPRALASGAKPYGVRCRRGGRDAPRRSEKVGDQGARRGPAWRRTRRQAKGD